MKAFPVYYLYFSIFEHLVRVGYLHDSDTACVVGLGAMNYEPTGSRSIRYLHGFRYNTKFIPLKKL